MDSREEYINSETTLFLHNLNLCSIQVRRVYGNANSFVLNIGAKLSVFVYSKDDLQNLADKISADVDKIIKEGE